MPALTISDLRLETDHPAPDWNWEYKVGLYHGPNYLRAQLSEHTRSYWLLDQRRHTVLGNINFDIKGNEAISQANAPFGSFQGARLSPRYLAAFLEHVELDLQTSGVAGITFHHPSTIYGQSEAWLPLLSRKGYTCHPINNHHLEISGDRYYLGLHAMHRRKFNKGRGLRFKIFDLAAAEEIYHFIAHCRRQRNQHLSLQKSDFLRVVTSLPAHFMLAGVQEGSSLAAAMITIKYSQNVWYNFYPAHDRSYDSISPMVSLIGHIYKTACQKGVKYLDLGTSQITGQANEGLAKFKARIGGIPTSKWICSKRLD